MAIITCPYCGKRMSSLASACPHCHAPTGELTSEEQKQLSTRRWKDRLYRAANLSYVALTMLFVGAIWWWFSGVEGWGIPAPVPAFAMVVVGVAVYLVARAWIFWLRLPRNRP